jgi:hypothetical protein
VARSPDERYSEALKLFQSGMKLVDIASQLNLPEGTVRRWKSTHKWDSERSDKNSERSDDISWLQIEKEYVTDIRKSPCSLEYLSEKYNIPIQTVKDMSAKRSWSSKRTEYKLRTNQKIIDKSSDKDADRILNLLRITDIAVNKAEQSLGELETYLITNKKKTKVIEYTAQSAPGKPTKEVIDEEESISTMPGPVDKQGLLFITSSLKNIKDLYSITADNKMQEHKIDHDNKKFELDKTKAQITDDGPVEDDGFLEALSRKVDEIWQEE